MKFTAIQTKEQLAKLSEFLSGYKEIVAVDLETESKNPYKDDIVGIGLSWDETGSVYIPIKHRYDQPFEPEYALNMLKKPLETLNICGFNILFDLEFLDLRGGIRPKSVVDASLLAYITAKYESLSLKNVCSIEFPGIKTLSFRDLMVEHGLNATKSMISELPIGVVSDYCGRDALATYLLYNKLYKSVQNHPIYKLESMVLPVTLWMRQNGVLIDRSFFDKEENVLLSELDGLKSLVDAQISEAAGEKVDINLGSSQQLGKVLYKTLKFRCDEYTETGQPRTDKEQLAKYKWKHPLVKNIITYKELKKLLSTYYSNYMKYVEKDGRIHASFNQIAATTGRYSCSEPNLQNIPAKKSWTIETPAGSKEITANMRGGFVVPEDCWFVEFDYSQIEARLAAGVTQEPILLNAFAEGIDYHTKTASLVFSIPVDSVTKEQRKMAKRLNFALSYGMGVNKLWRVLSEEIPISYKDSAGFRDSYVKSYPTMFHMADVIGKNAERTRSVDTIFGRRIPVFEFLRGDEKSMQDGRRMAYNGVIQGSAADVMKRGLLRSWQLIKKKYGLDNVKLIMTIHDSMEFEVKKTVPIVEFVEDIIRETSLKIEKFPYIFSEPEIGTRWSNLQAPAKGEPFLDFFRRFSGEKVTVVVSNKPIMVDNSPGRVFVVELPEFTKEGQLRTFTQVVSLRNYLITHPGKNKIVLKIGSREETLPFETSVGIADKDRIVLMIGAKFYERVL
jgi:DNA polymerase-1